MPTHLTGLPVGSAIAAAPVTAPVTAPIATPAAPTAHSPTLQTDRHAGLAGRALCPEPPNRPRVRDAQHASPLSHLHRSVLSRVSNFLAREEIAALAATSRVLRHELEAHTPTGRMLAAWRKREEWIRADGNQTDTAERDSISWQQYSEVTEALVQADAARLGRSPVNAEEASAACDAAGALLDDLLDTLSALDLPAGTRMETTRELVSSLEPLVGKMRSRGKDCDLMRRWDPSLSVSAHEHRDALQAGVAELMANSPPQPVRAMLGQIEAALEASRPPTEQEFAAALAASRASMDELLRTLSSGDSVQAKMGSARRVVFEMRPIVDTIDAAGRDFDVEITSQLRLAVTERSPGQRHALRCAMDDIKHASPPQDLRRLIRVIEETLMPAPGALERGCEKERGPVD